MDRILATHTGSLIRPPELLAFMAPLARGEEIDQEAYAKTLKEAVNDTVERQVEAGIDVPNDGEMGKESWITYLYERVTGLEPRKITLEGTESVLPPSRDRQAFPGFYAEHDAEFDKANRESIGAPADAPAEGIKWVCTGPIQYDTSKLQRDIDNLKEALEGKDVVDAFLPVVAPASAYWLENEHYATEEEFVYALADALKVEYNRIHDAGIMVSVDDAVLWHMFGTIRLRGGTPDDYRRWAQLRVDALNPALEGIPADRVRYHICSGSDHAAHTQDPLLRDVIDMVLQVNARYLLIEQGNARHEHEWRIWEDVELPDDKVLVPGVVTHQTMMVEHPELVAQRLTRLAKLVGRERVMAGTDCGFAQTATTKRVPLFTQGATLEALGEGAAIASKELWGTPVPA